MATVTGGYSPGEEEETFSRRGRGAGKFQPPGPPAPENFAANYLTNFQNMLSGLLGIGGMFGQQGPVITGNYDPELAQAVASGQAPASRVTGDVQNVGSNVTTGGSGRGSNRAQVTSGRGGNVAASQGRSQQQRGMGGIPGLGRAAFIGGMVPSVLAGVSELQADRPFGAAAAVGAGAITSAAGAALLKAPHPLAKLAGGALLAGNLLGVPGAVASGAESGLQSVTGKPTSGKEDKFSTQMAMRGQITQQNLDALQREQAINLQTTKDLTQFMNEAQLQQFKAMAPELEKAKMNDFARYQTAMALQGQIQGKLGVLATAGALAQGQQQGNYLLANTSLQNSPYTQAIMPAPQIRFG
jgi:hypothetical protein